MKRFVLILALMLLFTTSCSALGLAPGVMPAVGTKLYITQDDAANNINPVDSVQNSDLETNGIRGTTLVGGDLYKARFILKPGQPLYYFSIPVAANNAVDSASLEGQQQGNSWLQNIQIPNIPFWGFGIVVILLYIFFFGKPVKLPVINRKVGGSNDSLVKLTEPEQKTIKFPILLYGNLEAVAPFSITMRRILTGESVRRFDDLPGVDQSQKYEKLINIIEEQYAAFVVRRATAIKSGVEANEVFSSSKFLAQFKGTPANATTSMGVIVVNINYQGTLLETETQDALSAGRKAELYGAASLTSTKAAGLENSAIPFGQIIHTVMSLADTIMSKGRENRGNLSATSLEETTAETEE